MRARAISLLLGERSEQRLPEISEDLSLLASESEQNSLPEPFYRVRSSARLKRLYSYTGEHGTFLIQATETDFDPPSIHPKTPGNSNSSVIPLFQTLRISSPTSRSPQHLYTTHIEEHPSINIIDGSQLRNIQDEWETMRGMEMGTTCIS
jgi:hypothetical protein